MDMRKRQPIGVELVKRGIVSDVDIEKALAYQREHPSKKLGDILYGLEITDPKKLIEAIGDIVGEKGILLRQSSMKVNFTAYFSLDIAKKNKAVPFEEASGKLKVCFPDTINRQNMETIRLLILNKGLIMEPYITFESDIDKALESFDGGNITENISNEQGTTITGLVDRIIRAAMEKRASDIHIEPQADMVRVRYRVDRRINYCC